MSLLRFWSRQEALKVVVVMWLPLVRMGRLEALVKMLRLRRRKVGIVVEEPFGTPVEGMCESIEAGGVHIDDPVCRMSAVVAKQPSAPNNEGSREACFYDRCFSKR